MAISQCVFSLFTDSVSLSFYVLSLS